MRAAKLILLFRLSLLVAIVASAILVIDYQAAGAPTFCGAASGCAKVRASEVGQWIALNLGVPLPTVSVLVYIALLGGSLFAASRLHLRLIAAFSALGGLFAAVLIALQLAVIDAVCAYCMAVDGAAIVAGAAAVLIAREASRDEASTLRFSADAGASMLAAWCLAGAAAVSLPFVWARYPAPAPVPPAIAALSVPGKLTVVMATDFECPYCRKLSPVLHDALAEAGSRVALVRIMAPLDFHPGAMPAAKAYLCAPEAKRDAMADALYAADPSDLTRDGVLRIAEQSGIDLPPFAVCLDDPKTEARVVAQKETYKSLDAKGLPFTYVGTTPVLGFDPEGIHRAVARELEGGGVALPLWSLFAVLACFGAAAAFVTLRAASPSEPSASE